MDDGHLAGLASQVKPTFVLPAVGTAVAGGLLAPGVVGIAAALFGGQCLATGCVVVAAPER